MAAPALDTLGLRAGEQVRFKRLAGRRWQTGSVRRVETDGSITLHDSDGSARTHRPEEVMVRRPGSRGRLVWRYVSDVAVTWEQLALFVELFETADRRA